MNKTILTAALALSLFSSVHAQTASASSGVLSNLSVNGTMDLESQYIFRGKKVTNAALQPSVNVNYGNVAGGTVTGYVWTNQPVGRRGDGINPGPGPNQNDEYDLGLKYDNSVPNISDTTYELGFQMYWYPNFSGNPNWVSRSYELHAGLTYDTTKLLGYNVSPSLTYFHDLVLDSNTIQLGATYTWDLSDASGLKGLSLTPTASLAWTGVNRVGGDQLNAGLANWSNGYVYYELDLELDYKPNNSGTTTFFVGAHYAGNTDGTTGAPVGFIASGNPQSPGSANSIWGGFGVKFNQ
jgi:hypothetical protein